MSRQDVFGLVGQVLDGQFRVDEMVGEGGFSAVYRGKHIGLEEPIAVKCLKLPSALGSAMVESFIRRFRDESRLHYRLSQGNLHIARSIASGTTMAPATGALVPYMVLEWLEGLSLAEDLENRRTQGKTGRSLDEVVRLLDSAADGLAYAHSQGVVHRDVNPGNLFIAKTQGTYRVKVLDFGVAKIVSDHALEMGPRAVTLGHIRIFAPAYGAPEQFDENLGGIGPWSDVYSFTQIMVELLRDVPSVDGDHLGQFAQAAVDPIRRPTPRFFGVNVADEVEAVFARALALHTRDRWQDVGEFWGALKNAIRVSKEHVTFAAARATAPLEMPMGGEILTTVSSSNEIAALVARAKRAGAVEDLNATIAAPDPTLPDSVGKQLFGRDDDDDEDGPTMMAPSGYRAGTDLATSPSTIPPGTIRMEENPFADPPRLEDVEDDVADVDSAELHPADEPQRTLALANAPRLPDRFFDPPPETPIVRSAGSPLQTTLALNNPAGFAEARAAALQAGARAQQQGVVDPGPAAFPGFPGRPPTPAMGAPIPPNVGPAMPHPFAPPPAFGESTAPVLSSGPSGAFPAPSFGESGQNGALGMQQDPSRYSGMPGAPQMFPSGPGAPGPGGSSMQPHPGFVPAPGFATPEAAAPSSGGSKRAVLIAVIALMILLVGAVGLVAFMKRGSAGGATKPPSSAGSAVPTVPVSVPMPPPFEPPPAFTDVPQPSALPSSSATAPAPTAGASGTAAPAPTAGPTAVQGAPTAMPWPSATQAPSASASTKASADVPIDSTAFSPAAGKSALDKMSSVLASCKNDNGVTGPGSATVSFTNEGSVAGVALDPPYEGTAEGACVVRLLSRAKTTPFQGPFGRLRYSFVIPK